MLVPIFGQTLYGCTICTFVRRQMLFELTKSQNTARGPVLEIPGVGKTFRQDFARIGIHKNSDLKSRSPEELFEKLTAANAVENHATSKNYLYVIRMAVHYANGGRDAAKLKWHAWKSDQR